MYYVTMTDTFMSDWGQAKNRTNKLVLVCETRAEACTVRDNAKARSDMESITIEQARPRYYEGLYKVSWHDKADYPCWYKEGYFSKAAR